MFLRIPCFCASEIAVSPADCTPPEGFELWALWVKNCDLIIIPGFTETQQQFVYVLGPAEANGKDSDQVISQAWDYSLAAMFCFFLFAHGFFNCFPAGGLASGVSEATASECSNQSCDEEGEGGHDVSIWWSAGAALLVWYWGLGFL